jgi:hypothetical protein
MNTETSNDVTIKTIYHSDHSMDSRSLPWCLSQVNTMGFFLQTFTIPEGHSDAVNALWGPACGDEPVAGTLIRREGRSYDDKMIDLPCRPSRLVTVIGIQEQDGFTVFTAHGGPAAEKNPFQVREEVKQGRSTQEDVERADAFWFVHALSSQGM